MELLKGFEDLLLLCRASLVMFIMCLGFYICRKSCAETINIQNYFILSCWLMSYQNVLII